MYDYELTRHGWEVFDCRTARLCAYFATESEARIYCHRLNTHGYA